VEIRASAEDYLETILLLSRKSGGVRSIDIVEEMGFSRPSVSIAMKKLRANGYIATDEEGIISLTETGEVEAKRVYERHAVIRDWLLQNGVSAENAAADACRMEHILSEETFALLERLLGENSGQWAVNNGQLTIDT
jgi:Mn-dependent DtxR family transcriptional regulator